VAMGLMVAACGPAGPPPKTYVLGAPPAMDLPAPLPGRPVIEIERVLVPDYLDGTDILVRGAANLVEASRTGRWRERLSAGVTRALASGLSRRLPDLVVVTRPPPEPAACQLQIDVEAFDAEPARRVTFTAQWRVVSSASQETAAGERVSLIKPLAGGGDEPIVAAMSGVIEDLAERIAAAVRRAGPACGARDAGSVGGRSTDARERVTSQR